MISRTDPGPSSRTGVARWRPRVLKRDVVEARISAVGIREAAQSEAHELVDEARRTAESIHDEAAREGFEAGLRSAGELLSRFQALEEGFLGPKEEDVIRLSLKIARKILGDVVESDPEAMVSLAREALKRTRRERHVVVRVHPNQLPAMHRARTGGVLPESPGQELSVQGDASLPPEGLFIETELGTYQADSEVQLRSLAAKLKLQSRLFASEEGLDGLPGA